MPFRTTATSDQMNKVIRMLPQIERLFEAEDGSTWTKQEINNVGDLILEMICGTVVMVDKPVGWFTDEEVNEYEYYIKPRIKPRIKKIGKLGFEPLMLESEDTHIEFTDSDGNYEDWSEDYD